MGRLLLGSVNYSSRAMRRMLVLLSLSVVSACQLFSSQPTTAPEPEPDYAAQRKAKMTAAFDRCKAGDDTGCAEIYTYPEFMNQVSAELEVESKREAAMNVMRRACKGGNTYACTHVEQRELVADAKAKQAADKAEYEANLTRYTAEEIAKVQLGWTTEQMEEALGEPCKVLSRRMDPSGSEHTSLNCTNSDGSGAYIDLVEGKVTQVRGSGR